MKRFTVVAVSILLGGAVLATSAWSQEGRGQVK
jgi:hypothetical protein